MDYKLSLCGPYVAAVVVTGGSKAPLTILSAKCQGSQKRLDDSQQLSQQGQNFTVSAIPMEPVGIQGCKGKRLLSAEKL